MGKGQGISINVIVIAAIALIILVILSTLVIRSGSKINTTANDCNAVEGGACVNQGEGCGEGYIPDPSRACKGSSPESPLVCCRRLS